MLETTKNRRMRQFRITGMGDVYLILGMQVRRDRGKGTR